MDRLRSSQFIKICSAIICTALVKATEIYNLHSMNQGKIRKRLTMRYIMHYFRDQVWSSSYMSIVFYLLEVFRTHILYYSSKVEARLWHFSRMMRCADIFVSFKRNKNVWKSSSVFFLLIKRCVWFFVEIESIHSIR